MAEEMQYIASIWTCLQVARKFLKEKILIHENLTKKFNFFLTTKNNHWIETSSCHEIGHSV